MRMPAAQDKHPQDGEEGVQGHGGARENENPLEGCAPQKGQRHGGLNPYRDGGQTVFIDPPQGPKKEKVLADSMQHTRPGEHHGADRGHEQQSQEQAHDRCPAVAEGVSRRHVAHFHFADHGLHGRHRQKHVIEQQVRRAHQ